MRARDSLACRRCIVYLLCYFALAVWTYGIQVPSGLFVPGIITGCSFGRLAGEWVRYYTYDPNCYDTFTGGSLPFLVGALRARN